MEVIKEVSQFFLLSLGLGLNLFGPLVSPRKTGIGFFKLLTFIGLFLFLITLIVEVSQLHTSKSLILAAGIGATVCLFWGFIQKESFPRLCRLFSLIIVGLFFWCSAIFLKSDAKNLAYLFLTSTLLGATVFAMLLGHWYLVVPKLSERPLLKILKFIWVFLLFKCSLFLFQAKYEFKLPFVSENFFDYMMLGMRFLWGYMILVCLSIFAWKLVKMRSLQSATGIFYVMVFFVLTGELISIYYFYHLGIFL